MIQKLELLIVEDGENHMNAAKSEVERRTISGIPISVDYATNLSEARGSISCKQYDGIVSDVFFPAGADISADQEDKLRESLYQKLLHADSRYERTLRKWRKDKSILAPLGVQLFEDQPSTPFIHCTDGYHHGDDLQPVFMYLNYEKRMILVDGKNAWENQDKKEVSNDKRWDYALFYIIKEIASNKHGVLPEDRRPSSGGGLLGRAENNKFSLEEIQKIIAEEIDPYVFPSEREELY